LSVHVHVCEMARGWSVGEHRPKQQLNSGARHRSA